MPRSVPPNLVSMPPNDDPNRGGIDNLYTTSRTAPPSPSAFRRNNSLLSEPHTGYQSLESHMEVGETTSLLGKPRDGRRGVPRRSYTSISAVPGPDSYLRHSLTSGSLRRSRHHSRANSQSLRFSSRRGSIDEDRHESLAPSMKDGMTASFLDERNWYDQFTSTDWVHDSIADGARLRELRKRKDIRGRLLAGFDGSQGWILVAVIGCITAAIAYFVDVTEHFVYDLKEGFCTTGWSRNRESCCADPLDCSGWKSWSQILGSSGAGTGWLDHAMFILWMVVLSVISCYLTLFTKTVVPSSVSLATLDENLGAGSSRGTKHVGSPHDSPSSSESPREPYQTIPTRPAMVYYSAAGSGVAEVKVINSGFVLHGYLGFKTLVIKTIALVFSISSGLSLGKEGPYVHIAACVGNIACRLFSKYNTNDGKRREVLSASAASGVAVAFGAPIGGVLFSLEEVSYYFPPKTLFRTFFCCIAATLSLKFLNPYGTGKIVLFEVRYITDWAIFEIVVFMLLGVLGGAAGALFIKASSMWARSFRRIPVIKRWPMLEVVLVAAVTGVVSFWNRYTKLPVSELMFELASPCDHESLSSTGLCPTEDGIGEIIRYLLVAFVIKSLLTVVTFGLKVPAGIYVPSMVVGGLMGRIVGHVVQYLVLKFPNFFLFSTCPASSGTESCVVPGVYAMVAAGATMCGVTRLSVTLAVILFELTGSLNHVLPFSLAVLCAKWTADALEPRSIYDLLTDMNSYPFLDNKIQLLSDAELGDIVRPIRRSRIIDISESSLVPATELRSKLQHLLMAGELDSGLPILRDDILCGIIPAPDLEYALDTIEDEEHTVCLMSMDSSSAVLDQDYDHGIIWVDFRRFIDPAPISLDIHSPVDLVYQCFAKLGVRYLCVLRDGQYAGLVHKKAFVKYVKQNE
ncbi:chloride channel protein [Aspergillus clavatus NRRL 1]|uniref:Voltage-gated chloride channel (ClcA), putative n=1 Tax=Aspergillus clavatus (strain ATCC 1007 / CBS 513.65 / DSM 816 / NCTC 3887 / NRRL 1 / QM 1276 / 107) TaxID=344612 RepID=A1CSV3_ASPCL|nr:voltage-gated chloride channel (ClcA), putative [Aspergillus clavatus NRRL 1]EAW06390.1 voltage-gated chloride channel (ClcA), putative [Aspergillus clavatus NRRL 1]